MKLSLRGMTKNTINELKGLQESIDELRRDTSEGIGVDDVDDYFGAAHIDGLIMNVEAYHDIIVGILQGKCTIQEAKEFLFSCGKLDEVKLFGDLIQFEESK
jgi:hypothetical protein